MIQLRSFLIGAWLVVMTAVSAFGAEGDYSLRIGWGQADKNDFGEILSGEGTFDDAKTHVLGVDAGYMLAKDLFEQPIDIYVKGSIYRFYENGYQDDFWEATLYLKGYYNLDMWGNRLRLGAGEGFSMTSAIPIVEQIEAEQKGSRTARFLNYLDMSVDIDVGRLFGLPQLRDLYLGYALKHRSGIFGLINNVKKGGSNYDMVYIEKKF